MDESYVRLYRKSFNSSIWVNPNYWFVWCWILMRAGYQENKYPFKGQDIVLPAGSFITGRNKALKELPGVTAQTYRSAIHYLNSTNRITSKVTNRFTIIQVQNWKKYQSSNQPINQVNNQPVTNQQPTSNHKQESKNIYNIYTLSDDRVASTSLSSTDVKQKKRSGLQITHQNIIEHYEAVTGSRVTLWAKQASAIKSMLDVGYTEDEIKRAISYMANKDEFYADKGFDLTTVAKQLPLYKSRSRRRGSEVNHEVK